MKGRKEGGQTRNGCRLIVMNGMQVQLSRMRVHTESGQEEMLKLREDIQIW